MSNPYTYADFCKVIDFLNLEMDKEESERGKLQILINQFHKFLEDSYKKGSLTQKEYKNLELEIGKVKYRMMARKKPKVKPQLRIKLCPKCGVENRRNSKFCVICESPL
ncbi:MAG: hypothetical protein ACE5K0_01165 [Candidatus Methanofastidiosia archaeon]